MRDSLKGISRRLLGYAAAMSPKYKRETLGLSVFNFHEVTTRPSPFVRAAGLNVEPALFQRQVEWIGRNYHVISAEKLVSETLPTDKKFAMITFDDGWRGTFDNALPVLQKLGLPSTIFLNMGAVGGSAPLASARLMFHEGFSSFRTAMNKRGIAPPAHLSVGPQVLTSLSQSLDGWDDSQVLEWQGPLVDLDLLRKWDTCPLVSYGNHSYSHWNARAMDEAELRQDYRENAKQLGSFASYVPIFAFPNGQWGTCFDHREVDLLKSEGALRLFGAGGSSNRDANTFVLDRISILKHYSTSADLHFAASRNVLLKKPTLNDLMREAR